MVLKVLDTFHLGSGSENSPFQSLSITILFLYMHWESDGKSRDDYG